jgi:hypothetical protein
VTAPVKYGPAANDSVSLGSTSTGPVAASITETPTAVEVKLRSLLSCSVASATPRKLVYWRMLPVGDTREKVENANSARSACALVQKNVTGRPERATGVLE